MYDEILIKNSQLLSIYTTLLIFLAYTTKIIIQNYLL